jgi:hypothetical protein
MQSQKSLTEKIGEIRIESRGYFPEPQICGSGLLLELAHSVLELEQVAIRYGFFDDRESYERLKACRARTYSLLKEIQNAVGEFEKV